jgi:hypothetical protein
VKSNRALVGVLALSLSATTGCSTLMQTLSGITGGAPGAPGQTGGSSGGKASPEAVAGLEKVMAQDVENCERQTKMADAKFTEALGGFDATKMKTSEIVGKVRGEKVKVWIEIASPEVPVPMVRDSFMEEGKSLPNPAKGPRDTQILQAFAKRSMKVQPLLTPLRTEVSAVGGAMTASLMAIQACRPYTDAYARQIVGLKRSGNTPSSNAEGLYKRLLTSSTRADAMFASTVALIGTMQAGFADKDPKGIDQAVEGIKGAMPGSLEASDADGKARFEKVEKELGPADDGSKPPPRPAAGGSSLAIGGPLGDVAAGIEAIRKGDYLGALKSASSLAPAPLGPVFGKIASLFGLRREIGAKSPPFISCPCPCPNSTVGGRRSAVSSATLRGEGEHNGHGHGHGHGRAPGRAAYRS